MFATLQSVIGVRAFSNVMNDIRWSSLYEYTVQQTPKRFNQKPPRQTKVQGVSSHYACYGFTYVKPSQVV